MRSHPFAPVLAVLLVCIPAALGAQSSSKSSVVIASVTDAQSGQPIADAEVFLADAKLSAKTDWSGEARIANVTAGKHNFQVVKAGYDSLIVPLQVEGDSIGPVFRMIRTGTTATTTTLTPVTVAGDPATSYLAEFEKRRAEGRGRYLTADELEKLGNRSLVTSLSQSFGGLMTTPDPQRPGHNILTTRRSRPRLAGAGPDSHCGVDVYLDNSPDLDDLEAIHPNELAGVEYYPIESAPAQYRRSTDNCGVLVLWSKK